VAKAQQQGDVNVITETIGTGGDYATIDAWEQATDNDLVAANERRIGVLLDQEHDQVAASRTITGATTDATRYRVLRGIRPYNAGSVDRGPRVLSSEATRVFLLQENNFRMENFGIEHTGDGNPKTIEISSGTGYRLTGLHVRYLGTGTNFIQTVLPGAATTGTIESCIVDAGAGDHCFDSSASAGHWDYINCMALNGVAHGFTMAHADCTVVNCVAAANATDFSAAAWTGHNNASSDATAFGPSSITSLDTDKAFVDFANGDYRIPAGSPLAGAGASTVEALDYNGQAHGAGGVYNIGPFHGVVNLRNGTTLLNAAALTGVGPLVERAALTADKTVQVQTSASTTATVEIYGRAAVGAAWVLLDTLTDDDSGTVASWPQMRAKVTAVGGTVSAYLSGN